MFCTGFGGCAGPAFDLLLQILPALNVRAVACRTQVFVARQVGNRGQFFDRLRHLVVLHNEKDRKNGPISRRRSRTTLSPTDYQPEHFMSGRGFRILWCVQRARSCETTQQGLCFDQDRVEVPPQDATGRRQQMVN